MKSELVITILAILALTMGAIGAGYCLGQHNERFKATEAKVGGYYINNHGSIDFWYGSHPQLKSATP